MCLFWAGFRWLKHDPISHCVCLGPKCGALVCPDFACSGLMALCCGLLRAVCLLVLSPARTARFASFFLASVSKNSAPLCAKEDDLQNNLLRRKLTSPLLLVQEVGEFVLALRLGVRGLVASVLVSLSHCIVVGGPFPRPASRSRLCCRTARLCCGRWPSFWQSD